MKVWKNEPVDKHMWAPFYYCKRLGDDVRLVKHGDGTADVIIYREAS